jgi:hypothetical protein
MAKGWVEKLRENKVKEFSFYPDAFTPFKDAGVFELPNIDVDWEGDADDKKDADKTTAQNSTPSWIKNISFTVFGVTVGGAAVFGLMGGGATAPVCPAPAAAQQTVSAQTSTQSTGRPAGAPVVSTSTTQSSASSSAASDGATP